MEELKEFGLSDNEIEIYITLLKLGSSTANRVSELSGIKRSTTYDNLNLLINKGIVSSFIRKEVTYYEAQDPEKIIDLIEEKKTKIKKILPSLKKFKSSINEKSSVSFFEGKRGVLTILNDILDNEKELLFYGSRKMALISLAHYPENFILKRAEKGIKLKAVLAEEDKKDPSYKDKKIFALSELKFTKELDQIPANVFIFGEKVAFMTSEENPTGILIKDNKILQHQKKIFNILWNNSKK